VNPARAALLALLRRMRHGQLTVLEGPRRTVLGAGAPQATIFIRDPRAWPLFLRGSRGLAEAYIEGLWDSPDLTALIRVAARNAASFDRWRSQLGFARVPLQAVRGVRAARDRAGSREDIHRHYDLGNDLFKLMLDEQMMYSCAYFSSPGLTLDQAATAKLELICSKLDLGPSDHVVEIGSGWGGFAAYAAATRGCRVTTTTISEEQFAHAQERVAAAGVEDLVTVLFRDYRDMRGQFDKLVSIEMIEAVGWRDFDTYFECCSRLLRPDGSMLLQAIVIDDRAYEVEKASRSFIRTHVFPNGCLPSLEVIGHCVARHTDMRTVGLEDLTPHYALTLREWRERFEASLEEVHALGYGERFCRLWRLYLSYCEAGFAERRIGVVQMLMAKPRWRQPLYSVSPAAAASAAASAARNSPRAMISR
jgi:cyclopropane-fatty-acyl-phospholipid synthase